MPEEEKVSSNGSWRTKLPAEAVNRNNITLWSVLKQVIGKDLTRVTIPILFCEPLCFLQRIAEYLEYAEVLKKADECDDALSRLEYVAAFAVSSLSSNWKRMAKPFNPLLYETFELDRSEQEGYRFVAEQVSHHPPVSAFHAQADFFEFYGTVSPRIRFWGISVEIQTGGTFTLKLLRHNETYSWDSLNCVIHNIIIGEPYLTLDGTLSIRSSNLEAKVKIGKGACSELFEGYITDSDEKLKAIYGNWVKFFACCSPKKFEKKFKDWQERSKVTGFADSTTAEISLISNSNVLWKARPRPSNSANMYYFTNFTLLLNDPSFITGQLPKTDCRLRPDVRLFEEKKIDEAADEKNRLEMKQRETRTMETKKKFQKCPKWFDSQKSKDGESWIFNGEYWKRNFSDCEDIF